MYGYGGLCFLILFIFLPNNVKLLENGLARTPPKGWMSWGYYMCGDKCIDNPDKCLDEKLILSVVDAIYKEGYQEAGYEYIIIDDCWSERVRDDQGRLIPDVIRFPRGMKFIADYIHEKGLKFGMYTNIAEKTCMGYPGSRGHFKQDAETFAEWGVDYLKVDGCFVDEHYLNIAYKKLGNHLMNAGRSMVFSCSWPYYMQFNHHTAPDYKTISKHCNLWRNFHDVFYSWESVKAIIGYYQQEYKVLSKHHGPGGWNDPDMLVFGANVLTEGQSRIQLSVYAMLSAPTLLSCDMARLSGFERGLLLNMDLAAVGQDPLGVMAEPFTVDKDVTLWVKRHLPMKGDKYHSYSFAIVNMDKTQHLIDFFPKVYGPDYIDGYTVMDVFSKTYLKNITINDSITVVVPAEDVIMYTLFPL